MSNRRTNGRTARKASCEALLTDPALAEALADPAGFERLSDADIRAMRATRRHALATAGTAALLLAVGAGGWLKLQMPALPPAPLHYETARGEHADVKLADGSTLSLNGATSLDVALAYDRRTVTLRSGEAYFDVAHDPTRPFVVRAGSARAHVLGTAFDLDLTRGRVELSVYRGAVRFGRAGADPGGLVVKAGWRSRFRGGDAGAPSRFDVTQQDWRKGWLETEGMRLGDVVEALNRQGGPLVEPPPAALADIPIAGRFRLDNPSNLLVAIGSAYGFQVLRDEDRYRLEPQS